MKKKYFVISDIHGFYNEFIEALTKEGWDKDNPDHILISCGDLFDRGSEPVKLLKYIMSIPPERRILIRGNHEDLIEDCCYREEIMSHDIHNGTDRTVYEFSMDNDDGTNNDFSRCINHPLLKEYLKECRDFYELGDKIFVHSWIPTRVKLSGAYVDDNWRNGKWEKARWENPFEMWRAGLVPKDKTIIFGHFHTSWAWCFIDGKCSEDGEDAIFDIYKNDGIIGLDACTAYSGQVNVYVFEG